MDDYDRYNKTHTELRASPNKTTCNFSRWAQPSALAVEHPALCLIQPTTTSLDVLRSVYFGLAVVERHRHFSSILPRFFKIATFREQRIFKEFPSQHWNEILILHGRSASLIRYMVSSGDTGRILSESTGKYRLMGKRFQHLDWANEVCIPLV